MIAKLYQKILQNQLRHTAYLFLNLMVISLQLIKQVKLDVLAESIPLPILLESRRRKLRRFFRLKNFTIETIWFPCIRALLEEIFNPKDRIYLVIDRTSWSVINILMVSVVYDHRAWPIYWTSLDKKGNSNLSEQKAVLSKSLELLSAYDVVVLGDREFCSTKLGHWLAERKVYFCLRQKCDTKVLPENEVYQELRDYGLKPGMKLFLNDLQVTKNNGFGTFNVACKWKRNYRGVKTKEPWYILTNFEELNTAIVSYQKRFAIEEMFRDFKSGGYSLEGSKLGAESLSKLIIVIAIAYTSAILQGRKIEKMGIQKYVVRPETKSQYGRRHSAFYVGQHQYHWLYLGQITEKIVEELLQINRRWVKHYKKGKRAREQALSMLQASLSPC